VDWDACVGETCPGRVSGVPVLKNSRLPTDSIVSNYDSGESPEEIADVFEVSIDLVPEYSTTPHSSEGAIRVLLDHSVRQRRVRVENQFAAYPRYLLIHPTLRHRRSGRGVARNACSTVHSGNTQPWPTISPSSLIDCAASRCRGEFAGISELRSMITLSRQRKAVGPFLSIEKPTTSFRLLMV
jgi:hypothetical protein